MSALDKSLPCSVNAQSISGKTLHLMGEIRLSTTLETNSEQRYDEVLHMSGKQQTFSVTPATDICRRQHYAGRTQELGISKGNRPPAEQEALGSPPEGGEDTGKPRWG